MHYFQYKRNKLYCEDVPVAEIAGKIGTPFYLYSQATLKRHYEVFDAAFRSVPHLTCYAVKANSNLAILSLFRQWGAGFDIVSGGELLRLLQVKADPQKIVFSGVGKTQEEIDLAVKHNILQFNIESSAELEMIEGRARSRRQAARIAFRLNPNVDPETHPYLATGLRQNKFGIPVDSALELYRKASRSKYLGITGIGFHIGSQITRVEPFVDALNRLKDVVLALRSEGLPIQQIDLGGGLGITYDDEIPPHPAEYANAVLAAVKDLDCTLLLEPGRVIVGNAGVLITRVVLTKENEGKHFVVVDAAMNDLMRPSLYGSHHRIQPETLTGRNRWRADVVGPICESADFLARDREMPVVKAKELLAIMSAGAYGFALSSNYNSRPRAAEVLVSGRRFKLIRNRESFKDLVRGEFTSPF